MSLGCVASCAYPRSCSNFALLVFTYSDSLGLRLWVSSAYACGYPRSCSNFALLVFTYSDSCRHSIKMEGRSGALHPARILVVVQTSHCSFSHTRIRAAIPLKWNVVTDVGNGHFFALWGGGLCGRCPIITAGLRVVQTFCTGQNYHLTRELV